MHLTKIALITSILFLTSCSMFQKGREPLPPVKIITQIVEPELYAPPLPREVQIENVRWYVITKENMDEQITKIEATEGGEFVVFAITPQAYENMAFNLQEMKRYIVQSQEIILYYMEATAPKGKDGWLSDIQARRAAIEEAAQPEPEEVKPSLFSFGDIFKLF